MTYEATFTPDGSEDGFFFRVHGYTATYDPQAFDESGLLPQMLIMESPDKLPFIRGEKGSLTFGIPGTLLPTTCPNVKLESQQDGKIVFWFIPKETYIGKAAIKDK